MSSTAAGEPGARGFPMTRSVGSAIGVDKRRACEKSAAGQDGVSKGGLALDQRVYILPTTQANNLSTVMENLALCACETLIEDCSVFPQPLSKKTEIM